MIAVGVKDFQVEMVTGPETASNRSWRLVPSAGRCNEGHYTIRPDERDVRVLIV